MSHAEAAYKDYSACCNNFKQGLESLQNRSFPEAVESFQFSLKNIPENHKFYNTYLSYFGLAKTLNGDYHGVDLCRKAIESEKYNGDVYLNLARVEWFCRNRKNTIVALDSGLKIDRKHNGLKIFQKKVGLRKKKIIPFLSRSNILNHKVGRYFRKK